MARRRWVFTELTDSPSVDAIWSIESSSKYRSVMQSR